MKKFLILLIIFCFVSFAFAEDYIRRTTTQISSDGGIATETDPLSLHLDAGNDPVTGNLALGTDGTGQGLSVFSTSAGAYHEWTTGGNYNVYDAGNVTYSGYDAISLSSCTFTSDSSVSSATVTGDSVYVQGSLYGGAPINVRNDFNMRSNNIYNTKSISSN